VLPPEARELRGDLFLLFVDGSDGGRLAVAGKAHDGAPLHGLGSPLGGRRVVRRAAGAGAGA